MNCSVTGSRIKFTFDRPKGWPSSIKSGDKNYHAYNKKVEDKKGSASRTDSSRSARAGIVADAVSQNPSPGVDQPATPQGANNDASPMPGMPFTESPIKSYTRQDPNGRTLTINVTQPGHPLHPGYVARFVEVTPGGKIIVNNFGEGRGWLQSSSSPFAESINNVWIGQTQATLDALD